ncbi:unnamed protein product [Rhizopus microsporus]
MSEVKTAFGSPFMSEFIEESFIVLHQQLAQERQASPSETNNSLHSPLHAFGVRPHYDWTPNLAAPPTDIADFLSDMHYQFGYSSSTLRSFRPSILAFHQNKVSLDNKLHLGTSETESSSNNWHFPHTQSFTTDFNFHDYTTALLAEKAAFSPSDGSFFATFRPTSHRFAVGGYQRQLPTDVSSGLPKKKKNS